MSEEAKTNALGSSNFSLLESAIKFIFSWVALMPIAVIVSGHFLSQVFRLNRSRNPQFFRIPIPRVIEIRADGDSVLLGFSGFLITLFLVAVLAGKAVYELFKMQFGIDPGQFNALCIFSSLATVLWSSVVFLIRRGPIKETQELTQEHDRLIEQVTAKKDKTVSENSTTSSTSKGSN